MLFFVVGVVKTCGSFAEVKKPEHALKLFVRFVLAKALITYGMELMLALLDIIQGVVSSIMNATGFGAPSSTVLPAEIADGQLRTCNFLGEYPPVGGDPDWRAGHLGAVLCDDFERLWTLF